MQATASPTETRPRPRVARALPVMPPGFPLRVMARALGWVIRLLRQRSGLSADALARAAHLGPQTLRDLELGRCADFGWKTAGRACLALHRKLTAVEQLTERYLWREYHRQEAAHRGEACWKMVFPWSKKRARPRTRPTVNRVSAAPGLPETAPHEGDGPAPSPQPAGSLPHGGPRAAAGQVPA